MTRGYVRNMALSANQLLHIPLAGDFQMSHISSHDQPPTHDSSRKPAQKRKQPSGGTEAMDTSIDSGTVLARADPTVQEGLARENVPDPLAGEQTWPTEEVGIFQAEHVSACRPVMEDA